MKIRDLLYESDKPYHYVGDCTNSFDSNGECQIGHFSDVSDFAMQDEDATEISKKEFDSLVNLPPQLEKLRRKYKTKYLSYSNGLIVMYIELVMDNNNNRDLETDIHYFFAR